MGVEHAHGTLALGVGVCSRERLALRVNSCQPHPIFKSAMVLSNLPVDIDSNQSGTTVPGIHLSLRQKTRAAQRQL